MNIPNEMVSYIFEYIPLHIKLQLHLNKYFNNLNKNNLNKNVIIIQQFIKNTKIPSKIKNILDNDFDIHHNINERILKRYLIINYPIEYIHGNIKLALKKLPNIDNKTKDQLLELINNFNNKKINYNYYINKYVNILTIEELSYVGL